MKNPNHLTKLLLSIFLTITAAFSSAAAEDGGVDTGGGNTVNGRIVSTYIKPINEISGYQEIVAPTLADISSRLPSLGKFLTYIGQRLTFYVIPRKLRSVPETLTGLPFQSHQSAMHIYETGEVFIDDQSFANLNTSERGKLLLQEILEQPFIYECWNNARIDGTAVLFKPDEIIFGSCSREKMAMIRKSIPVLLNAKKYSTEQLKQTLITLGWYTGPILGVPGVTKLFE